MSWASRRRSLYVLIVIAVALIIIVPIAFYIFNKEPTCTDGKQNGQELGVDCGGICEKLCEIQISDPVLLWSRTFKVSDGVYNTVAYIENPNFKAGVSRISYIFKLFDSDNLLVAERKGRTFISPNGITPIFEGAIRTGERTPVRAFFEFTQKPEWIEIDEEKPSLSVSDIVLSGENSSPRIDAVLSNTGLENISDIEVVASLFDSDGNAIAVSSTFIKRLSDRSSQNIVFTWPSTFDSAVSRIEIIPRTPLK